MAERLSHSLDRALAAAGLAGVRERLQAVLLWDKVVGETVAAHARALNVRGDVLEILVSDSAWANQIAFLKGDLMERINSRLGREMIRDIRVRVGMVPAPEQETVDEALNAEEIARGRRQALRLLVSDTACDETLGGALVELAARINARRRRRAD